jgi:hypothetical protein
MSVFEWLTKNPTIPTGFPANCNLDMAADEIRDMLQTWRQQGAPGEELYCEPEFYALLTQFLKSPWMWSEGSGISRF